MFILSVSWEIMSVHLALGLWRVRRVVCPNPCNVTFCDRVTGRIRQSVTVGQGSEIYDGSFLLCLPGVANISVLPEKPCIGGLSAVNRKLIINCDSSGP